MFAAIFYKNYLDALKSLKIWSILGWLDIYKRYRRSRLGQIWIVISTLVLVGSISFIFSTLFKSNYFSFLVYIVNNLCLWIFFREIVEDSSLIFIENESFNYDF
jgi:ABC-type polysaccharide/polyol phosphate export permease